MNRASSHTPTKTTKTPKQHTEGQGLSFIDYNQGVQAWGIRPPPLSRCSLSHGRGESCRIIFSASRKEYGEPRRCEFSTDVGVERYKEQESNQPRKQVCMRVQCVLDSRGLCRLTSELRFKLLFSHLTVHTSPFPLCSVCTNTATFPT